MRALRNWKVLLALSVLVIPVLFIVALPSVGAQGTAICPIQILMQDTLYLRGGPTWNSNIVNTLVAGNVVCLNGRDSAAAWLQVSQTNGAVLGWGPSTAFWANVPFTVLPVVGAVNPTPVVITPVFPTPTQIAPYPTPTQQMPGTGTTYVVQAGDTVYSISQRFGVTIPALMAVNSIPATYVIYVGQLLNIPGTGTTPPPTGQTTYVVKQGEYLVQIAARYGLSWVTLAQANNIGSPYIIYPGQTLIIPVSG